MILWSKKYFTIWALGLLLLSSCGALNSTQKQNAQDLIEKEMTSQNLPGLSITVVHHSKEVFEKGYGWANIQDEKSVDPNKTLFRVASISKSFTSALMIELQKDGLLHHDSSVYTYLPNFPEKSYDFSLKQIGGHTAGIRSYKDQEFYSNVSFTSVGEAIKVFENDSLLFEPGTRYAYSSYGWNLLSRVCEAANDHAEYTQQMAHLFSDYGMTSTYPNYKSAPENILKQRTAYYTTKDDEIIEEPEVDVSNKWAGGGFESTSSDVALFAQEFWFGNHFSDDYRKEYVTPQNLSNGESTSYGIGWISGTDKKGRQWYGHAGGGVGAKAMMIVYPKEELIIAVLCNSSKASLAPIYFGLADIVLEEE